MERITIGSVCGAALALASPAALAQGAPSACYLQVGTLVSGSPDGVSELGEALRRLDMALRPQVEEIKVLEQQLLRIEERQREALNGAGQGEEEIDLAALQADAQRLTDELQDKRDQLKLDYATQRAVLVEPVQVRVSERARAFAAENGCAELKMARAGDLASLRAASARDMTPQFVAWYGGN